MLGAPLPTEAPMTTSEANRRSEAGKRELTITINGAYLGHLLFYIRKQACSSNNWTEIRRLIKIYDVILPQLEEGDKRILVNEWKGKK